MIDGTMKQKYISYWIEDHPIADDPVSPFKGDSKVNFPRVFRNFPTVFWKLIQEFFGIPGTYRPKVDTNGSKNDLGITLEGHFVLG